MKVLLYLLLVGIALVGHVKYVQAVVYYPNGMCCADCVGGVCQAEGNCVWGGQTCTDNCVEQGSSCASGNSCAYDTNCSGYPEFRCVSGICVYEPPTPTTAPTSTSAPIPTSTPTKIPTNQPSSSCVNISGTACNNEMADYQCCSTQVIGGVCGLVSSTTHACYQGPGSTYTSYQGWNCNCNSGTWVCVVAQSCHTCCGVAPTPAVITPQPAQQCQSCGMSPYGNVPCASGLGCYQGRCVLPPSACSPWPACVCSAFVPTPTTNVPGGGGATNTPIPTSTPLPTPTNVPCSAPCVLSYNGSLCTCPSAVTPTAGVCPVYCQSSCAAGNQIYGKCPAGETCCSSSTSSTYTFTATPQTCTIIPPDTNCDSTIQWNASDYASVSVERNGVVISNLDNGTYNDTNVTTSCNNYVLKAGGITLDTLSVCASQGPTPVPWIKLKGSSFQSKGTVKNSVPDSIRQFTINGVGDPDDDDVSSSYFIIGEPGSVSGPAITPGSNVSSTNWITNSSSGYKPRIFLNKDKILSYIKSRKVFKTISSTSTIDQDGVYIWNGSLPLTLSVVPSYNFLLVVDNQGSTTGQVNINTDLTPTSTSFAIAASSIDIGSSVKEIYGILIADAITVDTADDVGLKIKGNLITSVLNNSRKQTSSSNLKPAIFISVDPQIYLDMLPYISLIKYEWKQLK